MIRAFLALTPFGGAFGVRSGILSVQSIPDYRYPDPTCLVRFKLLSWPC